MKTILQVAALCGLAVAAASGNAQAQSQTNSVSLKVGAFLSSGKDARRAGGREILSLEADYVVQQIPEQNQIGVLSIGYIERDNIRILPLTISQITYDSQKVSSYSLYHGFGIGLYSAHLDVADTSGRTKTLFGGLAVVGLNLSDRTFVEAKYHYISKYDTKFIGGLQFLVGARF